MKERSNVGALITVFRAKRVIIAVVAATAMALGVMSIDGAGILYKKLPGGMGAQPAPANPFVSPAPTSRHTVEGAAPALISPAGQVASAETVATGTTEIDAAPPITPPAAGPPPLAQASPGPRPALPAPVKPVVPPMQVPLAPLTQPIIETVRPVAPLLPPPVQHLVQSVNSLLPAQVDTGLITITLPRLGL